MPQANNPINPPSLEDTDGYDDDPLLTLESIKHSKVINFPIRATYTKWKPREAFRELVQNWRDGIIKSFNLPEKDFSVVRDERTDGPNTEIVYKALRYQPGGSVEWLGYIRYNGCNGKSTVEITNRAATLQPWHLDFGGASKAEDDNQAGAHGEGLTVALLVLMRGRQNHNIRCRSGGFYWTFNFSTSGRLVAHLARMSPAAITKAADEARQLSQGTLLPFAAAADRDVQFVIGEEKDGRDERGRKTKRKHVRREDFDEWIEAALFLHPARDGTISTKDGDLLTDPKLRGNIYLKGLLLCESTPERSASIVDLPLRFGYNFASGTTNRERQSLASRNQESRAILAIWNSVLTTRPEMVQDLSDMLNTNEPRHADVFLAKDNMTLEMATKLRDHLVESGDKWYYWYYTASEKSTISRTNHIIEGFGYKGVELTDLYWAILRGYGLVRTAEEEEQRRFTAALPTAVPRTTFATGMKSFLSYCFQTCPQTKGMSISFVNAGTLRLDVFFSQEKRLFQIHDRWLTDKGAIRELGLSHDIPEEYILYHTVRKLFADALEQVPIDLFQADDSGTPESRKKVEVSRADLFLLDIVTCLRHKSCLRYESWDPAAVHDHFPATHVPANVASSSTSHPQRVSENISGAASSRTPSFQPESTGTLRALDQVGNSDAEYAFLRPTSLPPTPTAAMLRMSRTVDTGFAADTATFFTDGTTSRARATAAPGSFTVGSRIEYPGLYRTDREWYEAVNPENVRAVVGFLREEKILPEESRKRPRVDDEK